MKSFAIIGSLGLFFAGVVACSDNKTTESREENPSSELPAKIESTVVVDSNGNRTVTYDTIPQHLDSVRTINEKGDTVYKVDTVYVPADTTLYWVGNSALVITEISPANMDWLDEDGGDPGWIEIYNAGDVAANLKGYSLVEDTLKPRKWVFGDELIAAHDFRIVFCDKGNVVSVDGGDDNQFHKRTHTNWKLSKKGGSVYLIDPYFGIRDKVDYPELTTGMSWGIVDAGAWKYFEKSTPEQANTNSTGYDGVVPKFSFNGSQGGFYSGSVKLNPPTLSDGLKVRCTQDGSAPTENSPEFSSTIEITKTTVLRCAAYKKGLLTKEEVTNTYFIDESINMPVVSISVDPSFFEKHYIQPKAGSTNASDPESAPSGLYEDVEFPVHVEYYAEGSKSKNKAWETNAGISMMGNYSRLERKKSVAVVMREEYGAGWLHYSLFETRKSEKDKYKAFNLRNNGNRFVSDYFADALGGAILEGSGVDYQRSRQVVVFYNGKYLGIHDMRERYNKNYIESNYGIDASTVNMVKHLTEEVTASNGTADEYIAMLDYAAAHDFSKEPEAYEYMKSIMDVGNFADYMVAEMYIHNGDWPNNNVRAWRTPDQRWKFMIYDLDHGFDWDWGVAGFDQKGTNMFKWVKQGGRTTGKCYTETDKEFTGERAHCFHVFYTRLIKNPDFRRLFINHSAVMLQNYLNAGVVEKVRAKMEASIDRSEAERDLEENGQKDRGYGSFTISNESITEWARERDDEIISQYKSEFDDLGDMVTVKISSSGNGVVLMEGMNLPGSTANSTNYSGKFFSGNQMELTAVPAAGAVFKGWSDDATNTEKTRIVTIKDGLTITAKFD
jgi:hypothetical protein